MNNTISSADINLFSTTHPDVVRRTSISSVIISSVIGVLGIGAFLVSLGLNDASSTFAMLCLTGGTILFLLALFRLFWRSKEWVYMPTGSITKEGNCFFDVCDLHTLETLLEQKKFEPQREVQVQSSGNVRMDYMISQDKNFAAVQLYRFIPYTYEAVSSVFYLTGEEANAFVRSLDSNRF